MPYNLTNKHFTADNDPINVTAKQVNSDKTTLENMLWAPEDRWPDVFSTIPRPCMLFFYWLFHKKVTLVRYLSWERDRSGGAVS